MAAAEAENEQQHEEMETSGHDGNVVRVGLSRLVTTQTALFKH